METNQIIKRLLDKSGINQDSKVLIPHFNSISLTLAVHRLCPDLTVFCAMDCLWQLREPYARRGILAQVADSLLMWPNTHPNFMNKFSHVIVWDRDGKLRDVIDGSYKFLRPAGQIMGVSPYLPGNVTDENLQCEVLDYDAPLAIFRLKQQVLKIVGA